MKVNTIVYTKATGLGIFMYPHTTPVEPNTICSVLSRKSNKIYHVPFSNIKPYQNVCWCCHGDGVDSLVDPTCPKCHWVICPDCGACRKFECEEDGIIVLDANDPYGWQETTGYYYEDFLDVYRNEDYDSLGQGSPDDIEKCYLALLNHQLQPIIVVDIDDIGDNVIISLYIDKNDFVEAAEIIDSLNIKITYDMFDMSFIYLDSDERGGCIFCGSRTYGDILCPTCAGNVD